MSMFAGKKEIAKDGKSTNFNTVCSSVLTYSCESCIVVHVCVSSLVGVKLWNHWSQCDSGKEV